METRTPDLLLRAHRESDREAFVGLVSDPEVMHHLSGAIADPEGLFERLLGAQDPRERAWAIVVSRSNAFAGHIFITPSDVHRAPELGFVLLPTVWGRGFATQAAGAVVDLLEREAYPPRLIATVDPDHVAAQRVLAKVGFTCESTQRDQQGPYLLFSLVLGRASADAR